VQGEIGRPWVGYWPASSTGWHDLRDRFRVVNLYAGEVDTAKRAGQKFVRAE